MASLPTESSSVSSPRFSVPRWRPPSHPHGKPRQKRHHNKSRDGCLTCRRRRVKCDEQRPSCKVCLKRNLGCNYTIATTTSSLQLYQAPSSPLSWTHLDMSHLSFFTGKSAGMLSFAPHTFPDSHIAMASPGFPDSCHTRFVKYWNSIAFPMAYAEPRILELMCIFAERHRLALTTPHNAIAHHMRMLRVMGTIIDDNSPDVVAVGAMIFFAYERLNSAATGDEPADQNYIHYNAIVNMLPRTSEIVASYILPILDATAKMGAVQPDPSGGELILMPQRVENSTHARQCFADVLRSSNIRQSLERCLIVVLQFYREVRGENWMESQAALTILIEARYLRTSLELNSLASRTQGK